VVLIGIQKKMIKKGRGGTIQTRLLLLNRKRKEKGCAIY